MPSRQKVTTNHISDAVVCACVPRVEIYGPVSVPCTVTETHVQSADACRKHCSKLNPENVVYISFLLTRKSTQYKHRHKNVIYNKLSRLDLKRT